MWQLLLLLGAGFGIYTLTKEEDEKDGKNKDSKDNTFTFESKEYSDWKEELKDYIDAEGEDYALTEYDWSKVKNKSFQDALKNFKEKKKDLETAIKNNMAKVTGFPATLGVTPSATYAANATTIAAYVSFVLAAYDAANDNGKLEIIMKEYYLSTWGNGWEAYNAYRLTGFPKNMQQTVYSATPGFFIRSFYYPSVYVNRNLNAPTQKALGAKVDKVFWDNNADNFIN